HVANSVQTATRSVARCVVGIALHCRYVVWAHWAVEANLLITTHSFHHVGRPIVMECLHKMRSRPTHIAEMDEVNLATRAEIANGLRDIRPHRGKISLTKRNAIVV